MSQKVYVIFFTKNVDETKKESFFKNYDHKNENRFFSNNKLKFQPRT